ncbi:MAG: glycosyl hydrolase, partial [Phycisphaeraceae bacterium JB051]
MHMMRPVNILLSAFLLTLAPWCLSNALAQSTARWLPVDVQQFFIMPDQPAMVAFTLADASESTTAGGMQGYRICDYQDQLIKQGQAQLDDAGLLTMKLTLPRGFYTLSIDGTRQVFGIAALEPFGGPVDELFCMDSAMSWLVVQKNHYTRYQDFVKTRDQLVGVLKRSGIAMSRERLSWQGIEPQAGQWDWQTPRQFDSMRQSYQRHGVPIMEMFHHAPAYLGRTIGGHFPQDLHATARSFSQLQSRWQAGWGSVEIWNEPNIGGEGKVPADQYVPLAKAIRYAASKHDGHVPVGGPALAGYDKAYLSDLAENGLLANMDYMSFHTYSRAASLEQITSQYRDVLGAYQQQSIPVWITESGRPWTKGNDRPSVEDALDTALDNVMKVIEAKACGIERYFMFVYPFYEEHSRNFGVMDRLGTPLKAMAGYCHAVLALANKSYLGDWPTADPQIVRARVFADQQDAVLVLYTASTAADQPVKLKLPANAVVLGIDGRHLSPASNGQINVADGLVYVRLPREQIQSLIQTDTPAMQLNRMAKQARDGFESPSPIVMQFMPDEKDYRPGSNGYHLTSQSQNPSVLLSVRLVNLDDKPHEITVQLKRDDSLVDAAKTLTLAANTTGKVTWSIPVQWREQRHVKLSVQAESD